MAAHKGTSRFIMQRATAVLLLPLAVWFLVSMVSHLGADYEAARAWAAKPLNGVLIALFAVIAAWHMRIGVAEIVVDYIHAGLQKILLALNWLVAFGVIAAVLWAVYNISFAG